MEFSYAELQNYVDIVNAVQLHTDEVRQNMAGAFPDNDRSAYLDLALKNAELLLANAEALRNEVRALMHSQVL